MIVIDLKVKNLKIYKGCLLCYKMENYDSFIHTLTNKKDILKKIDSLYHVDAFLDRLENGDINNTLKYKIAKDIDLDMLSIYLKAKSTPLNIMEKIKKIRPAIPIILLSQNTREISTLFEKKDRDGKVRN